MNDRRLMITVLCTTALTTLGPLLLGNPALAGSPAPNTLPTGGKIVGGSASITRGSNRLDINQASQNAVINWQSFSVGSQAQTNFRQPSASSLAVNRVVGVDPSTIAGQISANGRVVLTNPNGVVVSQGARIDTGSFIATTAGISNRDAMNGTLAFTQPSSSPTAAVVNHGEITVAQGGLAALVAPGVANDGVIQARLGKVALASGQTFTIDLNGDRLVNFAVNGQVLKQVTSPDGTPLSAAVTNAGRVIAGGGRVEISVDAAKGVVDQAINMSGIVEATTVHQVAGAIVLDGGNSGVVNLTGRLDASAGKAATAGGGRISIAGDVVSQTGTIDASGALHGGTIAITARKLTNQGHISADAAAGNGGAIAIQAASAYIDTAAATLSAQSFASGNGGTISVTGGAKGTLFTSGSASVRSAQGFGGSIEMSAGTVKLVGATLDASGDTGGGTIEVGGGLHGQGTLLDATTTLVIPGTTLDADARTTGNGGSVVVWSNQATTFAGTIDARGGAQAGNGGAVEVSSKGDLVYAGTVDVTAAAGATGSLLLDPANIVIDDTTGGIAQYQLIDPDPTPGATFGEQVTTLSNGNIVVTNPADGFADTNSGAVYLYNGHTAQLISALTGSQANDQVGSGGVDVLNNDSLAIFSANWGNGATANAGAVTWANPTTGVAGVVSAANSLVGSNPGDRVGGNELTSLNSGNYLVATPVWNSSAGAVTFINPATPTVGVIAAANSLVGSNPGDFVGDFGFGITLLTNGNYVVASPNWNSGGSNLSLGFGAVTFGSGTTGVSGAISASNSLVGTAAGDQVGLNSIVQVGNSNYVVVSSAYGSGGTLGFGLGAVTWGSGTTGISGAISPSNSLVGSVQGDQVGSGGVTLVGDGNYVVVSRNWTNPSPDSPFSGATAQAGAVTWGNGNAGVSGTISAANSLVGDFNDDNIGSGQVTVLTNGNYVVVSPNFQGIPDAIGAVTWGNGNTGVSGDILDSGSSLVGVNEGDDVGSGGVVGLSNGNFVVLSPDWNFGLGAATWGDGTNGFTGQPVISASNSLIGASFGDHVSSGGVQEVGNSNYVVLSPSYQANTMLPAAGAVTWGDGTAGVDGVISSTAGTGLAASLVGSQAYDQVGSGGTIAVGDGNYLVVSPQWGSGGTLGFGFGAVTWINGNTGQGTNGIVGGAVAAGNSIVGNTVGDQVGSGGITQLFTGNYAVLSPKWGSGGSAGFGLGAVTWGDGNAGTAGAISATAGEGFAASLTGSAQGDQVGSNGVAQLDTGNYVVISPDWGAGTVGAQGIGAATWINGSNGQDTAGNVGDTVSAANSLVGSTQGDVIGIRGIQLVGAGNYVVLSPSWNSAAGAVTWGDGTSGTTGTVSASNSIVGASPNDQIGAFGIATLFNGNYVVHSPFWANDTGAMTFANGNAATGEVVSAANSLVGSASGEFIGNGGVEQVGAGNYAVISTNWNNSAGAVTWGSATAGVSGVISAANSLVGGNSGDSIGALGINTLSDGNYVVLSPDWNNGAGAATFAPGDAAITGVVSAANSLVGSHADDEVGSGGVDDLFNGTYLVFSPNWNGNAGAISIGSINTGLAGVVSTSNSLVGQVPNDELTFRYFDYQNQAIVATSGFVLPCECDEVSSNTGGKVILGLLNATGLTFDLAQGQTITLTSAVLEQALQTADVTLQANNDITFDNGVTVTTGGRSLTLEAGRAITIAANSLLVFDGDFTATANDGDPDLVTAERQPGAGGITMNAGASIDTSAADGTIALTVGNGITPGAIQLASLNAGGGSVFANGGTAFTELTGSTIAGSDVSISAAGAVTLAGIDAGAVFAQSGSGGDITLNGTVAATGGGDAAVLASGGNFINNAGAGALTASGGRWLVYSQNPDSDAPGGLVPGFIQYGATYPTTPVADAVDNGFLYSVTPVVTLANVIKTYDGTTNLVLTPGNYTVSGALGGDTVTVAAASGNYATANAGTGIAVSISDATVNAVNGTTPIYGYQLAAAIPDTIGTILPAPLTVTVDDASRSYGSGNATFTVTATGLQGDDTVASLNLSFSTTAQAPGVPGIGASSVPAGVSGAGSGVGTYPLNAVINDSNYIVTSNPGTLTITPATLTVVVSNDSRDFGQPNPPPAVVLSGLVAADTAGSVGLTTMTTAIGGLNGSGGSLPGAYPITASITNPNYVENLVPGTLTILATSSSGPTEPSFSLDQLIALLTAAAADNAGSNPGGSPPTISASPSTIALLLSTPLNQLTSPQREQLAVLVNQALGNPGVDTQPFHLPLLPAGYTAGGPGDAGAPWRLPDAAITQYPDAYQYLDAYLRALWLDTLSLPASQ